MSRALINRNIRRAILTYINHNLHFPTRQAIAQYAQLFNVPKQVVSGNISWLVRSGQAKIYRNKPYSYLY
jgi:hypothetical protein